MPNMKATGSGTQHTVYEYVSLLLAAYMSHHVLTKTPNPDLEFN